ncbi:MAG TPA: methyltransferase domain-containing protein [Cyclobacteriaceae bacterium]|nr:methyltransferase domain-containing protein [Cyclobacteriaceae bacterium]
MMDLSVAVRLIRKGVPESKSIQHWIDLGAGTGLFTRALASLLPPHSTITAVDKNKDALRSILWDQPDILLNRIDADYSTIDFKKSTDGFLLANSLHFCSDPVTLLNKLKQSMLPDGRIIIIEYNSAIPNAWVPYPVSFENLNEIAAAGFRNIELMETVNSKYQAGGMYAAVLFD